MAIEAEVKSSSAATNMMADLEIQELKSQLSQERENTAQK